MVLCQLLSGPACVLLCCVRRCALEPQGSVATLPGPEPERLADRGSGGTGQYERPVTEDLRGKSV